MQQTLAGIVVGLLILAACESPSPNGTVPDGAEQADTVQTPSDDTAAPSPQHGQTRQDEEDAAAGPGVSLQTILDRAHERDPETGALTLLDRLNEPQSTSAETRQNTHDPSQTDTLRTRRYDGLELTVYHVSGGKEILKNVTVAGSQYQTDQGLSVGMTRSELESLRGQPEERQDGTYIYNLGGGMPTMLHISFSGDEVSRMEWQYPID